MHTKTYIYLIALVVGVLALSCKEEEIVEKIINIPGDTVQVTAEVNYTDILAFTVPGGEEGSALKASVREDSIYLYWPVYWDLPEHIVPEIAVAEKAGISPASGEEVALKTGEAYTVTAEDGTEKAYFLNLVVNQTPPWFQINSGSSVPGGHFNCGGDYIIPDTAVTALYLVPQEGGEDIKLPIRTTPVLRVTQISGAIPADIDTGYYNLKLVSGWRTVYPQDNPTIHITYPAPALDNPTAETVKRGETYTLAGANFRSLEKLSAQYIDDNALYELEILSYDLTTITVKVPLDFPLGQYSAYRLESPLGTNNRSMASSRRLTIVE